MNHGRDDPLLLEALEAAHREARATDAQATRTQRARSAGRGTRRRGFQAVLVLASFVLALGSWAALHVGGPSVRQLESGRELVLELAAQHVRDAIRVGGAPPSRLADELPVAAGVKMELLSDGVRLSIANARGVEHVQLVPFLHTGRPK